MIDSAEGFDEILIHINGYNVRKYGSDKELVSHVEHKQNLSICRSYNALIEAWTDNEWICCFCDDDYFYPEGLSKIIYEIRRGNARDCEVAHFKFHISGYVPLQDKRCWFGKKEYDLCEKKEITPKLLEKHNRLPAGSFFRKRAWEMVGGFHGDKCHDWDLWKRMAQKGIEFKYFDYLVYNHVRRENSAWCRQNENLQSKHK